MFKTLQAGFPKDKDMPARQFRISALRRVLNGTLYDELPSAFHEEKNTAGEYVPLRNRRPCVRYGLCKLVVQDSVSMLFSEGHFPEIDSKDREAFKKIIKETKLNAIMIDAAERGSVGSVAIFMRVLKARMFFDVMETDYLTPEWNPEAPDTPLKVREKYKVKGRDLRDVGYSIADDDLEAAHWFQRDFTDTQEIFYIPWKVTDDDKAPKIDKSRTVKHDLGFVPVVWVKNLPGGDDIDGSPTFSDEVIDTNIEIDYQLSQAGRGLKYSSDPTLLIKEPAMGNNGKLVKGAGNALVVDAEGDAKLLEINGTAADAVLNYVEQLRKYALETMHGNRADSEKLSAAQSGRAMELMNQALVWLSDRLRISYGEGALADLLRMVVKASQKLPLVYKDGEKVGKLDDKDLVLRWPAWYQPTADDKQAIAGTLKTHIDAGVMSQETATRVIGPDYDIEDVTAERGLIEKERAEAAANEVAMAQEMTQQLPKK